MSLDKELQKAATSVPECVAAGYVDMVSGMLLGAKDGRFTSARSSRPGVCCNR